MRTNSSAGFTLVEVMIVAPIIILFVGAFIGLIVSLTGESLRLRESNAAAYNVQDAIDDMQEKAEGALGFLSTTGTVQSPQGKNSTATAITNNTPGEPDALIIKSTATTKNPIDPTAKAVYSGAGSCNSQNPAFAYTIVYMVVNKVLYKRTILQQSAACQVPWQRNSCKESDVSTNASICQISDEKLLENVNNIDIQYYSGATSTSPLGDNLAESATSISINVTLSKTVSGEALQYTGSARVSSPNSVQAVTGQTSNSQPAAANIVAGVSATDPYTTDFTWDKAGNATSYSVRYRPDAAASWTTTTQNVTNASQAQYTQSVATLGRKQTAQIEVTANTASGSYAYGTASRAMPRWTECPLPSNGWNNYDVLTGDPNYNTLGYTRTATGAVGLKGLIRGGTFNNNAVCTLPVGFRPANHLIFNAPCTDTATASCRIDIFTNGIIAISSGNNNGWVSLDGIIFMTAAGNPIWQSGSWLNGWVYTNYGDSTYPNLGHWTDNSGRVWVQGLGSNGPQSVTMANIPSNRAPATSLHYPVSWNNRIGVVNVNAAATITSRASTNGGYVSTQLLYYPTGTTLSNLNLINSWAPYSGWATPQCRSSDDIVVMQGLIRAGNTATNVPITNVNSSCGSALMSTGRRALLSVVRSGELQGRVDLDTAGNLLSVTTDAGWTSLDGVHYIAD